MHLNVSRAIPDSKEETNITQIGHAGTAVEANRGYYNGGAGGNTSSRRPRTDETSLEEGQDTFTIASRLVEER
jgi:hypothetical protein